MNMIQKKQITVGRLIGVYEDRGNNGYAVITSVDQDQDKFSFTNLDTLIERQNVLITESLNGLFPASKKEVFQHFSNQKKKNDNEIKKLQDVKLHLIAKHLKAKELIKNITGR